MQAPRELNVSDAEADDTDILIGRSASFRALHELIGRVAPAEATVLIVGESGTGKEVAARSIHRASRRARGPFVPVNMAAIPLDLAESLLFGHEKWAFTGAQARGVGYCEAAHGGTLFLDEITEMDVGLQAKLLRFLEEQRVQPVGAVEGRRVDVRVLAATNRDPEDAVRAGLLREDVYYRLNVVSLKLAPLRERAEDIRLFAAAFLAAANRKHGRAVTGLSQQAIARLEAYHWPGNIRQLKHCIERAVILSGNLFLDVDDLPPEIAGEGAGRAVLVRSGPAPVMGAVGSPAPEPPVLAGGLQRAEAQVIVQELSRAQGSVPLAARALGLSRATLYRKIKQYGIRLGDRAASAPPPPCEIPVGDLGFSI